MAYVTKNSSTYTGAGQSKSIYDRTNKEPSFDSNYSPINEFYSVGIDQSLGLKEKITNVHGINSEQTAFVNELEDFLGDNDKYNQVSTNFESYVSEHINIPQNTTYLVDEFINSGYITALERLCNPSSKNNLNFCEDYASERGMEPVEALLFGPNGTARQAVREYKYTEMLRGQHRSNYRPEDVSMAQAYDEAVHNTKDLPQVKNKEGKYEIIDIDADSGKLPQGLEGQIANAFNREPQLYCGRWYKGTKRLKGDLAYRILEAFATEYLVNQEDYKSVLFNTSKSELEKIIENANKAGQDAFFALHDKYKRNNKAFKYAWNKARKRLNDYAELIWQKRDSYNEAVSKRKEEEFPGTIYLNNGRYYWMPKCGEKAVPLIPEKEKNRLPGSLIKNNPGGYFWWIPHLKFRRRLVPDGEKVATKDYKTAKKLQLKEWEKIQKYEPQLAQRLKNMRKWGAATKHKPTAVKIAKKLWTDMKENDSRSVARIISDKRPEITKPNVDKVWPSWEEEKTRLSLMENAPQIPIVYPEQRIHYEWKYGLRVPTKLKPIVDKIKKINWLTNNIMLVFDDNSPSVSRKIAIQSNGKEWTDEQARKNKNYVMQGSTSIDRDTGRIRFTIYSPGYGSERVLAEEVYHIVFGIIRETSPKTFRAIQTWHKKNIDNGVDPTLSISEAFSQAMVQEEVGYISNLPRNVVKHAKRVFSDKNNVSSKIMQKVKSNLFNPQEP